MKINKNLLTASKFNPTESTQTKTITDLCKMIETGEISLPVYQRDLSWTLRKCIELLDYQLLGKAPVSPISMNKIQNTEGSVSQISFVSRDICDTKTGQLSVVDGQQRLTTNYKAYMNHNDFKTIALDLQKGYFIQYEGVPKEHQIPVGTLLNKDDQILIDYCAGKKALTKFEVTSALLQIKSKIKNYSYTLNQATDLNEEEQMKWFEVLNNAGSRVTDIQMHFAKMKNQDMDIYNDYAREYVEQLNINGYAGFFKPHATNLTYPVAALNPAYIVVTKNTKKNNYAPMAPDTKQGQLSKLEPEKLRKCFAITLTALDRAITFIDAHNLKKPNRIDFINYLLGFFVVNDKGLTEKTTSDVIKWYNETTFTNKTNTERRKIYESLLHISNNL